VTTVPWPDCAWHDLPDIWQCNWTFPVGTDAHDANVYDGTPDQLRSLNQEAPVALTDADVKLILAAKIPNRTLPKNPDGTYQTQTLGTAISNTHQHATDADALATQIAAALETLPQAVADLIAAKWPTPADLADINAIRQVVKDATDPLRTMTAGGVST
jgi:hypothetical protein